MVIADEAAAPAAPKMVVEPTMEVMTEDPSVMTDWRAEVVMADPAAPPEPEPPVAVPVAVPDEAP